MRRHQQADVLLDLAARQIRQSRPDPQRVAEAARRVWSRLTSDFAALAVGAAEVVEIRGCSDYQALIPAYLAGNLPPARKLLVEDHTGGCVPCRRALKEAREGKAPRRAAPIAPGPRRASVAPPSPPSLVKWALAAVLVTALGISLFFLSELVLFGAGTSGKVQTADADLIHVGELSHLPLAAGDEIPEGETIRTGRDGGAVVELGEGSLVEMRERTQVSIHQGWRGTTIRLGRGSIVVRTAPPRRRLRVATEDCLVAVKGAIFSVNHGIKGSRVSVVEGEVRFRHGGRESRLLAGDQTTTHASLKPLSIREEIAWSRDADRYLGLLREPAERRRPIPPEAPSLEKTYPQISVTFQGGRRRELVSWLAAPAPMGALDFISPEAKVVAAIVFKDPVKMLDDVVNLLGDQFELAARLRTFERNHGLSLDEHFAAMLGGDLAFAVDGPLLPTPAWKLVVEVSDPARFQLTVEEVLAQAGNEAPEIRVEKVGGRTFYTLPTQYVDVHYTFAHGYLLAAPRRALLDRAIRLCDSGYGITDSAPFTALLPVGRRNHFSALLYLDVATMLQPLAEHLAPRTLSEEQRRSLEEWKTDRAPSLGYACAEEDRITVAAASDGDFLAFVLTQLGGLSNPAGLEQLLKGAGLAR